MKIEPGKVSIKRLTEGFNNPDVKGSSEDILGMGGKLNIRPAYQRDFIYEEKDEIAVIETLLKKFPLNSIYWVHNGNGHYEVLDGQQRITSICRFVAGAFMAFDPVLNKKKYFDAWDKGRRTEFLKKEIPVHMCEGSNDEKLAWFRVINISNKELYEQELRNAVHTGPWLSDAKEYFSRTNCMAHKKYGAYLDGKLIRQDYLETALRWVSDDDIDTYMGDHQFKQNAHELRDDFEKIMKWVISIFGETPNKHMKGLDYGTMYKNHGKRTDLDPAKIRAEVKKRLNDREVQKKSGIYNYVLDGEQKWLNLRQFEMQDKEDKLKEQGYKCAFFAKCGKDNLTMETSHADHILPWIKGGSSKPGNLQVLCRHCNFSKSDK